MQESCGKKGSSENSVKCIFSCLRVRRRERFISSSLEHYVYQPFSEHSDDTLVEEAYLLFSYQITRRHFVLLVLKFVSYVAPRKYYDILPTTKLHGSLLSRKPLGGGGGFLGTFGSKRETSATKGDRQTNLTYDELQTIVVEIEGLINARPLTYVYDDVESVSLPLTPSHLVYGRRITTMPNSEHYEIQSTYQSLTRKAKHHRNLLQRFTKQWKHEYLLALREQSSTKSRANQNPEIAVGDIVIIRNDQTKRIFWKLAKVEQLLPGDDGVTRAAEETPITHSCYDVPSST